MINELNEEEGSLKLLRENTEEKSSKGQEKIKFIQIVSINKLNRIKW